MTRSWSILRSNLGRRYRNLFATIHYRASLKELRRLRSLDTSPAAIWNVTQTYRGKGWFRDLTAWQIESEFRALVEWVAQQRPRVILEIGTAKGATLLAWSQIASELVVSVDLPGGIHGGGYPAVKERLFRSFVSDRPDVGMMIYRGDSHSAELRDRVKAALHGRSIDFLFIDGDHTYAGVTRDFQLWTPLVTSGGHVAFHDILPHRELRDCQVDRFWAELKQRYTEVREFVEDPFQGWAGVGILTLSSACS